MAFMCHPAGAVGKVGDARYEWPMRRVLISLSLCPMVVSASVAAQDSRLIGIFGNWSAFVRTEAGKKVCYMGSVPDKETGEYERRGGTFVLVTHRPSERRFDVVSVEAGYTYKEGTEVTVLIGGQGYPMFISGAVAWARDAKADRAMVGAMKRGLEMVVRGTSSRSTLTEDTYLLSGFTAAHAAIAKACGVK
jgi:hypothetical protein